MRSKGKHKHKTISAYKVKYTVMSKDSKHFLELVIQKIMHCWRRKQVLTLMKGFHVWKEATLTMDLDTARQVKELRNKVRERERDFSFSFSFSNRDTPPITSPLHSFTTPSNPTA